jgi:hypothetical protein
MPDSLSALTVENCPSAPAGGVTATLTLRAKPSSCAALGSVVWAA